MMVLIDTSVWSLALRRGIPRDEPRERELAALVREGRVVMVGPVRQELLSGIRTSTQYEQLRTELRNFPDLSLGHEDYEVAALCCNRCRAHGVQGGSVDFLICAIAKRRALPVFSADGGFAHYAKVLGIALHAPRAEFS